MKVVKDRDGNIVYRQIPDFDEGKGIINAVILHGLNSSELFEVEITQEEWDQASKAGDLKTI